MLHVLTIGVKKIYCLPTRFEIVKYYCPSAEVIFQKRKKFSHYLRLPLSCFLQERPLDFMFV